MVVPRVLGARCGTISETAVRPLGLVDPLWPFNLAISSDLLDCIMDSLMEFFLVSPLINDPRTGTCMFLSTAHDDSLWEGFDLDGEDIRLAKDSQRGIRRADPASDEKMRIIYDKVTVVESSSIHRGNNDGTKDRQT